MKIVKGILSGIIGILIFVFLFSLTFSFLIKSVIKKDIVNGILKDQITTQYIKETNTEIKRELEDLLSNSKVGDLASELIDEYIKYTKNNSYKISDEFVDKIVDFCVENREAISKLSKEEITEEKIRSKETYENIRKTFNEGFPQVKDKIGDGKIIVEVYGEIVDNNSRMIVGILTILLVIIYSLINWSLYKFLSLLGSCLIIIGALYSGIYALIVKFSSEILKETSINLNPKTIIIVGIIEIIIGIILIVIKKITQKKDELIETY